MKNPINNQLVSVIIPTYNRSRLVARAIHSVLNQTYCHLECIVVDDASSDDTPEVIRSIEDNRLVYIGHETNRHASAARNTGLAHSKGSIVAFLDDDDEWFSTKLQKQIDLLMRLSETVGMVYCWMDYLDEQGNVVKVHHPTLNGYVFSHVLDAQRLGNCSTLLVHKRVAERVGGFDESLPRGNDGDFIRRVCREYEVDFVPEVLVKVFVGHGSRRITSSDAFGIRNAINSQHVKVKKFGNESEKYPRQFANIFSTIACHHFELGEVGRGVLFFMKALRTDPMSSKIYLDFRRALRSLTYIVRR